MQALDQVVENEHPSTDDERIKEELQNKYQSGSLDSEILEPLERRAMEDYGVDIPEANQTLWDRIKRYTEKFESKMAEAVLDDPKDALSGGQKLYHAILAYASKGKSELYMSKVVNSKVNYLLGKKLDSVKTQKQNLVRDIQDTGETIESLRKEKSDVLRKAGQCERDRAYVSNKLESIQTEMSELMDDLEQADQVYRTDPTIEDTINMIEERIGHKENEKDTYHDIIAQASSHQEIANERYDIVSGKLSEQRFIKGELRRYMHAVKRLEKKLELQYDQETKYTPSPLKRIREAQDVIQGSVRTLNRLAEASYISKDIMKGFPTFEEPETKPFSQASFSYDEKTYQTMANKRGKELASELRNKRRMEIRSVYAVK